MSIRNKQERGHGRNKMSLSIGQRMFLFSPETSNLAINIKKVEIENLQNGYSAGNTLRLRKLEYDPSR